MALNCELLNVLASFCKFCLFYLFFEWEGKKISQINTYIITGFCLPLKWQKVYLINIAENAHGLANSLKFILIH